jgi:alkylated DNA repair protein alkB homolog 1
VVVGLVILPAYLSHETQRHLIKWSLSEHARHPNETNLDAHYVMPLRGLWEEYLNSPQSMVRPKASLESQALRDASSGPRQLISNESASPETYQILVSQPKLPPTPSSTVVALSAAELLPKLRWANIGWSYHWGSKQYDFTKGSGTINKTVRDLCREVVRSVSWKDVFNPVQDSADWGASGPDWDSWDETYGECAFPPLNLALLTLPFRTRCWNS